MTLNLTPSHSSARGAYSLSCFIIAGLFLASALWAAEPATKSFDIPAAPAEQALKAFSIQSGQEVLFATATTGKVRTNAVKGDYTPGEAIDQILKGTGLVAIRDESTGTISITRDPNVQRVALEKSSDRPERQAKN